jgi:hypothetical protein
MCWCKCVNLRNRKWDVCFNIHKSFGHYSLGQVPSVPILKLLMERICSAVQLIVEVTVVEGRVSFSLLFLYYFTMS